MPEHINIVFVVMALAITFAFRFVALFAFLLIMIKIQKLNFTWLPLIGSAFLAAALDMIPLAGHFIAVPVLYFCVWKLTQCELVPDATFTVALSYACMRCVGWILLAYAPGPQLPTHRDDFAFDTNMPPVTVVEPTNQPEEVAQPAEAPPAPTPPPENKVASDISVKGVSGIGENAMVTIQYGKKDYIISMGEGTTISTDEGSATVRFVEADKNDVTLLVGGQQVKYAVQ